ncbi:rep protein [Escherichia coli]|nr:rep protein [Escherichia coli]
MEGAKNGFTESQMPGRVDTPNQGVSCRQELRQPPARGQFGDRKFLYVKRII